MKTILLSGFYISPSEWFIFFLFVVAVFAGLLAFLLLIASSIRKTDWYKNNTIKYKFSISVLIAGLIIILSILIVLILVFV